MPHPPDLDALEREVTSAVRAADVGVAAVSLSRAVVRGMPMVRAEWDRFGLLHSAEFADAFLQARGNAVEIVDSIVGAMRYRRV